MRRFLIFGVAIVFGLALLARMMAYTVRFTEAAILTTFGHADKDRSVKDKPGLYFKWPQPIQAVIKYDTRARFVPAKFEQQQTADDRLLVVQAYCTWKVENPLLFFQRFSSAGERASDHFEEARKLLDATLRSAGGEISKYRLTDLFTLGFPSKLPELEQRMMAAMQAAALSQAGIAVLDVGVSQINLPESTTQEVHNSMRADRARIIKELEGKGSAAANAIRSAAEANASKIEAFAKAYAAEIKRKGDEEAAQYTRQMVENPELAIFLKNLEMMREVLAKRATIFLDTAVPGFGVFSLRALGDAEAGRIPGAAPFMQAGSPPPAPVAERPADGGEGR